MANYIGRVVTSISPSSFKGASLQTYAKKKGKNVAITLQ